MLQQIIESFGLDKYTLVGLYGYGSRVYGTADAESDYDFIAVVEEPVGQLDGISCAMGDITIYDTATFQRRIDEHEISVLECLFLESQQLLITFSKVKFELDLAVLRRAISAKSSNSFVKAKKKMTVPDDFNIRISKKSLFSSLRIINFGLQISKHGRIVDYTAANSYWTEISENPSQDWEDYKKRYQPIYNEMMSEFRMFAPKSKGMLP